ncbi:hypothetical protein [Dankookia sp. P2]
MTARRRAEDFCARFGLRAPILMAPMAGACPAPPRRGDRLGRRHGRISAR